MKRGGDLALAALAAIVALPLAVLIAVLLRCTRGGPVLQRQTRAGQHGREFQILRFRTGGDSGFGTLLRRTGLEELPRLWNVVRGEMGVIGPRPARPDQLGRYSCRERGRFAVRPGLTGWAQLHGHAAELDLWYVEHRSLRLDLHILGLTILALVRPTTDRLRPTGDRPRRPG
ncbi:MULTISPECIES: sugar transferase [unclassified Kitasatospora]|uniref:sugar transferase n=1 Tax=unclassified Kitasatospora TaxID=2633591 RepID=UPI0033E31E54